MSATPTCTAPPTCTLMGSKCATSTCTVSSSRAGTPGHTLSFTTSRWPACTVPARGTAASMEGRDRPRVLSANLKGTLPWLVMTRSTSVTLSKGCTPRSRNWGSTAKRMLLDSPASETYK